MKETKQYVQFGCGLSAPNEWINFDASPTLRLQRIPVLGRVVRKVVFPPNVRFGNILTTLPGISQNSCDGVYCSHVLEHLSLQDCRKALSNSYNILKQGGIFRCVLPDLEFAIQQYLHLKKIGDVDASLKFMQSTALGLDEKPKGFKNRMIAMLGNYQHLWMWDEASLCKELKQVGFSTVRAAKFNDSADKTFEFVEGEGRFYGALAFEAIK